MTGRLLHLMRHGEPEQAGLMLGWSDIAVTSAGVAACVARAEGLKLAAVACSDLSRATACVDPIAAARGLVPSVDRNWRELNFGAWEMASANMLDTAALARFWDDPEAAPPPDGERWSMLVARVRAGLAALSDGPVLVVTHGGAIRAALHLLCGFALPQLWAFALPYAALLTLRLWENEGEQPTAQIVALQS